MTPEQGDRFLPAFLEDDDYHLACAEREPDADTALGVDYHRPATGERRVATTATRVAATTSSSTACKDHVANAPLAKLIAIEAQTDKGPALIARCPATRRASSVTDQPGPRWYHGASGRIELKDCRVPAGNLLTARRRCRTPAARIPLERGRQHRHRPRRLRGRGRIRAASRAGRPADRRASGDRHQARRHRDPARRRAHRGLARRPGPRTIRMPSPTAACPTCRSPTIAKVTTTGGGLSRHQGRRRMLRRRWA